MGGQGSGRKPDPVKQMTQEKTPIADDIFIPNNSGVQHEIREGTKDITTDDLAEGSNNLYDREVSLSGSGAVTIYGSYPDFTIGSSGGTGGDVDSVFGRTGDVTAQSGDYDHAQLNNSGANTHSQIDNHIASGAIHFSDLSGFSTSDLSEGTNLYYTDSRAVSAINNDGDHGSTASHNYFSGSYTDLTNKPSDVTDMTLYSTDDLSEGSTNKYDQDVNISGSGATTIYGSYPTFTIGSTDTDTTYTAGTGLSLSSTEFSTDDSQINHDNLNNYVSNEHIDWTNSSNDLVTSGGISGASIQTTSDKDASGAAFVRNVVLGTNETPPTASNFVQGTIYIQYTA